ncbi:MAG: dihydropyrimidinase [Ignavibacteriales bacterium]|nr:dihydropyrimidinase [Ignavibacteriales bacterium]
MHASASNPPGHPPTILAFMTMAILIIHGQVVTPQGVVASDVFIENEVISAVGQGLDRKAEQTIDATGKYVIPGGIDVHTHLDAPVGGTVSSDNFESGTRAAAFGGTTSIIDFATQSKGHTLREAYATWREKASKASIDYGLHMIVVDVEEGRINEIDALVDEGVTSFKLFTAYPGALMVDDATILQVMIRAGKRGALVAVHAEDESAIDHLVHKALAEGRTAPIEHALTRPASAEAEAVRRVLALARSADLPVYIVHVSSAQALEEISRSRKNGTRVFGETCPQYLLLTQQDLSRPNFEGAKFVLTPPLRSPADQDALWKGLGAGDIQVVSTDHCPFMFKTQKSAGLNDFTKIPNGGPGIENRLQLLYHYGVNEGRLSLKQWVDLVSVNPAKLFGLYPKKGAVEVGSDADVVIWNPNAEHIISASTHHMQVDYSMYEGITVRGNADTVISRGEIIVDRDVWLGKAGRGRYVKRSCFAAAWGG